MWPGVSDRNLVVERDARFACGTARKVDVDVNVGYDDGGGGDDVDIAKAASLICWG